MNSLPTGFPAVPRLISEELNASAQSCLEAFPDAAAPPIATERTVVLTCPRGHRVTAAEANLQRTPDSLTYECPVDGSTLATINNDGAGTADWGIPPGAQLVVTNRGAELPSSAYLFPHGRTPGDT